MPRVTRRAAFRSACHRAVAVFRGGVGGRRLGEGVLVDVSLSGARLLYKDALERDMKYRLRLEDSSGAALLPFRVARIEPGEAAEGRRYGLSFELDAEQRRFLKAFLETLFGLPPAA